MGTQSDAPGTSSSDRDVFRQFLKHLRTVWPERLPSLNPLGTNLGTALARSHTFDAGVLKPSGLRVLLRFDHSSKSWKVGQFTIDVIILSSLEAPAAFKPDILPDGGELRSGRSYRIGTLLHRRDKWWHLRDTQEKTFRFRIDWLASGYDDPKNVIVEAIDDVTNDVTSLLRKFRIVPE